VGVRSLTNGLVDTTTAHGSFVFGMFALMAEYEAALIKERTQAGLIAARQFTMAEIAQSCDVTPMTIYRHITTGDSAHDS